MRGKFLKKFGFLFAVTFVGELYFSIDNPFSLSGLDSAVLTF